MTAYQGGKGRLGKRISKIIKEIEIDLNITNSPYIEPFCGMCGVMYHMASSHPRRVLIANDANGDVVEMWKQIQGGWDPPISCSKDEFLHLKENNRDVPSARRGFLGSVSSYGNIFMGYYRLHLQPSHRDYIREGRTRILKIAENFGDVCFTHGSYEDIDVRGSLVYCDPPYIKNRFKTAHFQEFDHDKFWDVMREWSSESTVVISERTAPDDFRCIWSINRDFSINKQSLTKTVECLFTHESNYSRLSNETIENIKNM